MLCRRTGQLVVVDNGKRDMLVCVHKRRWSHKRRSYCVVYAVGWAAVEELQIYRRASVYVAMHPVRDAEEIALRIQCESATVGTWDLGVKGERTRQYHGHRLSELGGSFYKLAAGVSVCIALRTHV